VVHSKFTTPKDLRLKDAEECRTMCVSIEGLECAGEMVKALTDHSVHMTSIYRNLNQLTLNGADDHATYAPLFDQATAGFGWYAARKRVANSMKAAATAVPK